MTSAARNHYTITRADVGKAFLRAFGCAWPMSAVLGRVLAQDVGKRLYRVRRADGMSDILQVENEAQRAARLAHEPERCHEIVHSWAGTTRYVCEAERFTEHLHGEPRPYLRLLRDDEEITEPDAFGCRFLKPHRAVASD